MSNRFHNKWHRKNHHTYGNASNPDASHDPIASQHQPFLGEFVLQGALCAVAPMSAFAGYFYSNFTGLCAFAGYRAIQAKAFSFPGGDSIGLQVDSQNIAISAYAPWVGLNVYSMTHAISAYGKGRGAFIGSDIKGAEIEGGSIGAEIYSDNKAISANGFLMGAEIYSNRRAISAYGSYTAAELYGAVRAISAMSPNLGIEVYSNQRAISAYGSNVGIEVRSPLVALSASADNLAGAFYANNRALSAYGTIVAGELRSPNTGALIYGGTRGLSAYSGYTAAELYGASRALSAMSPQLGIEVYSNNRAISAYGTSIGLETASPQVALSAYSPKIAIRAYAPTYTQNSDGVRALDVRGFSFFDGDVTISGNLTAAGALTYLDTKVQITSSLYVKNEGTDTACTVIQTGEVAVAHFYDDSNSALFINGTSTAPGFVGINTATPNQKLTVVGNISGYSNQVSFGASRASGTWSLSEGTSRATGNLSHAEGSATLASGTASHTEGEFTTASGYASHAEGYNTTASGIVSHAEGNVTVASGDYGSHAEGTNTTASGTASHAEGSNTLASGIVSHAAGYRATASQPHSYIWSGDSTLGTNVTTSLDRQYLIYAPSGVFIPRGMVGIGTGTDYVNTSYPLTVNGLISSKGLRLWDNSKIGLGYFPSSNDGAEIFYQPEAADLGTLYIQTVDNADSKIVLRQFDQAGPTNYNRLVVGQDGNIGIGTGTSTTIDTFNTTLAVYGTLSSYNSYVGEKIYFGSSTTPDTNLYRSAANTLKTDDSFIVDGALTTINSTTITLGDANTDTVTINSGPVNFPSATTAADALILGGDANLYRSATDTLRTDDSLVVNGNITAPNQTYVDGTSVITGSLGDTRYGQMIDVFRTTDLSRQSTIVLADDDVLVIPSGSLTINKTYSIEAVLYFTSAVTTNGARIAFNDASAATTNVAYTVLYGTQAGTASVAGYTSLAAASNTTTIASGTTPITFTVRGSFRTGASVGNLALQWAQGTSIASNTTLKAGSYILLRRLD